jgi:hypothetical protein
MAFIKIQKKINVNTFSCDVIYIVSDNIYKVESLLHKKYGGDKPKDDDPAEGYTVTVNSTLYVMVLDYRFMTNNLIGHEIYHVTHRICNDRDIEDEETMAWLNGYLHEEFYKFIQTPKFKVFSGKMEEKLEAFIKKVEEHNSKEKSKKEIRYE